MIKVLVLKGNGINCENETARAFQLADDNLKVDIVHINALIAKEHLLADYDIFALPGGFSYGDEIQSGKILALKLKKYLQSEICDFIKKGKLILGICNGFQILTQLDVFSEKKREFSLTQNRDRKFINRWQNMFVNQNSFWTKGFPKTYAMPVRHGEGRLITKHDVQDEQILFRYTDDINGSAKQIAGLTNPKGNVLGLMPHPEAALMQELSPYAQELHPLFKNAINYIKENFHA